MFSDILSKVHTREEAEELTDQIDLLLASIYKTKDGTFDEVLNSKVSAWAADALEKEFAKEGAGKEVVVRNLKKELGKLRTFQITIAFEPSKEAISKIHQWLTANVGERVILDITYNPKVLAGAIITYKGKYADMSVRKKLEEEFSKKEEEIMRMLG